MKAAVFRWPSKAALSSRRSSRKTSNRSKATAGNGTPTKTKAKSAPPVDRARALAHRGESRLSDVVAGEQHHEQDHDQDPCR